MSNNNKSVKLTKSMLSAVFAEYFPQTLERVEVSPSGNVADFVTENGKRITVMLSRRRADEWVPVPTFAFSAEHLENAKAVGANYTLCYNGLNPRESVLVCHSDFKFLFDEFESLVATFKADDYGTNY